MNFVLLKRLRVGLSIFFLVLLTLIFIDFRKSFSPEIYRWAVSLQFVPSLLKSITVPGAVSVGFVVVLLLTVLFGRVYCSAICPLGAFQDVFSWFSAKFRRKQKFRYHKPLAVLRYSLLAIVLIPLLAGSITMVSLLDPYSLFGRISSELLKPAAVFVNNLIAGFFARADNFSFLYRYDLTSPNPVLLVITTVFLVFILLAAFARGRFYCNTVCPLGTFLGVISRFSIFKIALQKDHCNQCGRCAGVCKSECIEVKSQKIDHSRCVACFNCLTICKEQAISFETVKTKKPGFEFTQQKIKESVSLKGLDDTARRTFLFTGFAGIAALYGFRTPGENEPQSKKTRIIVPKGQSTIPEKKTSPVSPPGSRAIERFNEICTGCSLCVSACPTKVLQPSFLEYGLIGMMQPRMDYHKGLCDFDCTLCSDVCPTGAIVGLTTDAKHLVQIGQVQFEKKNCIVETEKTDCGACSEHCPTKAVQMVPYGKLFIPEIDQKICVGCGACEYACPTTPYKAIYVNGNRMHLAAEKPKTEKAKNTLKEGEFPF